MCVSVCYGNCTKEECEYQNENRHPRVNDISALRDAKN